jgi:hypothetical protein
MLQTRTEGFARKSEDPLQAALERLTRFLDANATGREGEWATDASKALGILEQALRQHTADAESPDGMFTEVDLTRPTLVRRVSELRGQHVEFLDETCHLQREVASVAQAFQSLALPAATVDALPKPAASETVPDFGALRERCEKLVAALRHHHEQEITLTLESVNTDIGAGD